MTSPLRTNWAPRRHGLAVAVGVWLCVVACGWLEMTRYSLTADAPTPPQIGAVWPANSQLAADPTSATLMVFLHPRCPCSRATMTELERLWRAHSQHTVSAPRARLLVVFSTPSAPASAAALQEWTNAPLVARSRELSGAQIVFDPGGAESRRFGARDSGAVMLYDRCGVRTYCGGITQARGHEGPNPGADAVAALLAGRPAATAALPAFGCRLVGADSSTAPGHAPPAAYCRTAAVPSPDRDALADQASP